MDETTDGATSITLETLSSDLADLRDLFRRRLLNDRLQRDLYDTLCQRLEETDGRWAREVLKPVLRQFLMVIDRIEAADVDAPTVESVRDELLEILTRQGVVRLPPTEGERFDPRWHFAVGMSSAPTREAEGVVTNEVRSGYLVAGEILRPADVEVGSAGASNLAPSAAASSIVNSESTERMDDEMGRGLNCRECDQPMYADKEDYQPKGTWIVYVCRNGGCPSVKRGFPYKEKVFEPAE